MSGQPTAASLFSGIGGLDIGIERAGFRIAWQCEADPYCRAVLKKHWPDVPCYPDVRTIGEGLEPVDLLSGGFPCQPVSLAGRRRGAADERWLWPEFARLIRLLRPRYALMENVPGLLAGDGMAEVLGDLAESGYDAEWDCIPAAAVGAPHLRYRVFIVAYPQSDVGQSCGSGDASQGEGGWNAGGGVIGATLADPDRSGQRERWRPESVQPELPAAECRREDVAYSPDGERGRSVAEPSQRGRALRVPPRPDARGGGQWATEPNVGRVANGVPARVDRLRALGNAVVPQVAEWIGTQLMTHLKEKVA